MATVLNKDIHGDKEVSLKTALLILASTLLIVIALGMLVGYKFIWFQVNQTSLVDQRLRAAREAARQNHRDPYKIAAVGDQYLRKGDLDRALIEFKKAYALDPNNPALKFNLGVLYKEKKDYKKAISFLADVLQDNPRHYLGHVYLGMVYRETGDYRQAVNVFKKALAINPGAADVYLLLGETYEEMGKEKEALENISKALRFVPEYKEAQAVKKRLE